MSFAVIFSKYRVLASAAQPQPNPITSISSGPTLLFQKCLCSEGSKEEFLKKNALNCEEVALEKFGERVQAFMESWETEGFLPIQLRQEGLLWKRFFSASRDLSAGLNYMSFQRAKLEESHEIRLEGEGIAKVGELCAKAYATEQDRAINEAYERGAQEEGLEIMATGLEQQRQVLKELGQATKDKVAIKIRNTLFGMNEEIITETNERIDAFIKKNMGMFQFCMIDPLAPHSFALAPTILKMRQVVNFGGIHIIHDYQAKADS